MKDTTKKIKNLGPPCASPYHKPPAYRVFKPGIYEHTCPQCGTKTKFTVPMII